MLGIDATQAVAAMLEVALTRKTESQNVIFGENFVFTRPSCFFTRSAT